MSPARIPRIVYPETGSHIAAIKPCLAPGTSVIARLQGLLMMSMHLQPSNGSANKQLRLRHSQKKNAKATQRYYSTVGAATRSSSSPARNWRTTYYREWPRFARNFAANNNS